MAAGGAALALAAPGAASPVLVLDGGHVEQRDDPYLPAADLPPPQGRGLRAADELVAGPTVRAELDRLLAEGQIDQATHDARRTSYNRARKSYKKLTGARKAGLGGALDNLELVAATGQLTPSRLPALFLTLDRNRQWWTTGTLPRNGQRIEFSGSELVFQNYTGEGLQIQELANFGKANGLWQAKDDDGLRALLDELVPLAADRGGVLTWEYYFRFGGGDPPWTSGMSQGTAVQALARAADRLDEPSYRDVATRALALFETAPPTGVRVDEAAGPHYLLYSFAPDMRVLNGYLQAIIGLYDFAELTGDGRAQALAQTADAEARLETPRYDTGAWSLYERHADGTPGAESSLSYHLLVRDFLRKLCTRTAAPEYCSAAENFTGYLDVPPVVKPLTRQVRAGTMARLRFKLSKISRVTVTVTDDNGQTVFRTTLSAGYGKRFVTWKPSRAGSFQLSVSATDLAGNAGEDASRDLEVLRAKRPA